MSQNSPDKISNKSAPLYEFAEFSFDAKDKVLFNSSEIIQLAPKACELLDVFIKNAGKILSKDDLMNQVWADSFVEEANLTHHISALRKALGEDKNGRKFIETIPRKGYRFVAPVSEPLAPSTEINVTTRTSERIVSEEEINFSEGETDASGELNSEVQIADAPKTLPAARTARFGGGRRLAVAAGIIVLLTAGFSAWRWWRPTARPLFFDDSTRGRWRIATVIEGKSRAFGGIANPSFAPDGKFIAFNRLANGRSSIFIKQIGGGEPIKLTDGKWRDYSPAWSPDGSRIAFISNRDDFVGVWTVPSLGGTPALLARLNVSPNANPLRLIKWSSGGGGKIFYQADARLYSQNLREAAAPQLIFESSEQFPSPSDYAVSPDESQFAFYAETPEGALQIFTGSLNGAGQKPKQITIGAGDKVQPAWFADNRRIAFSSNQTGNFQIYAADSQTGETVQLTLNTGDDSEPLVSADNRSILFHSDKDDANVYSYRFADKTETALTDGIGLQIFPAGAPDNSRAAFETASSANSVFAASIKIAALDGANQTLEVARQGYNPQWSPDGNSLVFVRTVGATSNLWKVSGSGQNEIQLTTGGINLANLAVAPFNIINANFNWSPDGKQIAFSSVKAGATNVWTIGADGQNEKQWTNNTGEAAAVFDYVWSPDSRRIAFLEHIKPPDETKRRFSRVCWTDGTETHTILETNLTTRVLGWSNTGQEIFVAQHESGGDGEAEERFTLLLKVPAAGGAARQIARIPSADYSRFRLSPDAQNFLFASNQNAESENLYVLPTAGGEPQRLTDNREPTVYYSGAVFSPDGKMIYYSKQVSSDYYALLTISD